LHARFTDYGENCADFGDLILGHPDFEQGARSRRGNLSVDLVGTHLKKWFIGSHGVTDVLQPSSDGALRDTLAKRRKGYFFGWARRCGSTSSRR
jgi:hypothetical protein